MFDFAYKESSCELVIANFVFQSIPVLYCMFANLAPCVPSPIYLSGCITSLFSCWTGEERREKERSAGFTQPTVSNRADIQYQATCTVSGTTHSYLLSSLSAAHLLSISAFRSPTALRFMSPSLSLLCLKLAVAVMDLSLCITQNYKTPVMQTHTCKCTDVLFQTDVEYFAN